MNISIGRLSTGLEIAKESIKLIESCQLSGLTIPDSEELSIYNILSFYSNSNQNAVL